MREKSDVDELIHCNRQQSDLPDISESSRYIGRDSASKELGVFEGHFGGNRIVSILGRLLKFAGSVRK